MCVMGGCRHEKSFAAGCISDRHGSAHRFAFEFERKKK